MRADNRGEGGLLALTALALRTTDRGSTAPICWIMAAGLVGAALFYGDGVITPAISVLSRGRGPEGGDPVLRALCDADHARAAGRPLPGAARAARRRVGGLFGPVMLLWFAVLALLGLVEIVQQPRILLRAQPAITASR